MALAAPCPAPDAAVLPDGELARRYAGEGDPAAREAAFRALVERHGAMVVAACRRVLRDPTEADDAAQAVFLVLARKAHALVEHPTLGGWLHRVACHVAWRLRDAERARDRREHAVGARGDRVDPALARFELREAIDAALDRLPARYRAPLVLHYLEGLSQDEVARALRLKAGTLASLLSRGRALLRDRLVRQGVAAGVAATAAAALAPASAAEPVFVAATTHTARLVAVAGSAEAACAAKVVVLSATTLRAMSMLKLKIAAAAVAAVVLVTSGLGLGLAAHGGEAPPAPAAAPDAKPEDAVLAPVKALRANDATALMKCWPDQQQQAASEGWAKAGGGNPWQDRMIDQVLANATSDTGAEQIAQFVGPFVGRFVKDRKPEETLGQVARGLLAEGLETEQVKALKPLGAAMTQWQDEAQLDDPEKMKQLCAHLIGALKALDVKDSASLKALDLATVLTRSNGALAELKQALAAFDIQVDAFLDSVKVTKAEGTGDTRTLTVAYTAFDTPLTMPVKVALKDGRWFLSGDSPLAKWLDQRPPRFGGPGGRNGGPGGRRRGGANGGGQNGANAAPADPNAPAPAPKGVSNF